MDAYAAIVALNYAAQVPYVLDLYGLSFSPTGALLLLATLAWFVVGYLLLRRGREAGYWIVLVYAATQFVFYLYGEVLLALVGSGLPYQLTHARDAIVWVTFGIGAMNFVAAALILLHLVRRRPGSPR